MNVKDIIREKRLALGMTMKEVADKVGVSEATISRWESGEIANMRRGAIFSLAKALNISPNEIMGWETSEAPLQSMSAPDPASILLDDEEIRTLARKGLEDASPEQAEKKKAQFKKIMSVVFDEDDDE
jgi:transcriptional regulator